MKTSDIKPSVIADTSMKLSATSHGNWFAIVVDNDDDDENDDEVEDDNFDAVKSSAL